MTIVIVAILPTRDEAAYRSNNDSLEDLRPLGNLDSNSLKNIKAVSGNDGMNWLALSKSTEQ